jgi:hypothetical protein
MNRETSQAGLFSRSARPQEFCMKLIQRLALGSAVAGSILSLSTTAFAGTGEFCSIPNASGTAESYECSIKYLPTTTNWLSKFKTWMGNNQTTGAMACFGPGTYSLPNTSATATDTSVDTNRLVLRNVQNMKLCAPTGGAIFEHKTVNTTATPLTATVYWPTLHIATSSGVSIKGMEFKNKTDYAVGATTVDPQWGVVPVHHVTRSVLSDRSSNIRFFDSKVSGLGKEVVVAESASISLTNATVSCAYYCMASYRNYTSNKPVLTVANSQFTINHTKDASDEHAALYLDNADYVISDSSFHFVTGEGFVAGVASTVDSVNLSNVTITGTTPQGRPKMLGWIPLNPNVRNIQINYTGATPPTQYGRLYFCIGYANPGCESRFESAGNIGAAYRYRSNASSAYTTAALPPARTKSLYFLNASGQDSVWARGVIVGNKPYLNWPVNQQWSSMVGGLNGFLDAGDAVLTGDFLVAGQPRVLFFNSDPQGGAFFIRSLGGSGTNGTMTTEAWIDWTPGLTAGLVGWHDANDKLLAGDFYGLGRSQLLFMNTAGFDGAFLISAFDAASHQLQTLALVPWSPSLTTSLSGWMNAGDKLVAGDFAGSGKAQLMFVNTDGGTEGAASIRQYDTATNAFQITHTVPWTKIIGNAQIWKQSSAKTLTGDFLGLNKDQLMFINPAGSGVAISIWSFDSISGNFSEVHTLNFGPSEIPNFNGFMESNDWQLGY